MRQTMLGLAVAFAAAVSAAPAMACGYSSCGSPSWNYNYSGFYGNYSQPSCSPCGGTTWATPWQYGRLSYPTQTYAVQPQYYYVNQGPTYTGPGLLAPAPTYQERAVSGWSGYGPTAYGTTNYSYSGGPYSNATTHYYDGMPAQSYQGYQTYQGYQGGYQGGYQSYQDQPAPRTYSYQSDDDQPAYRPYPTYRPNYARPMYRYMRPFHRMVMPRYYSSYRYAPHFRRTIGVSRYALPPRRYFAPRYMTPRYGVPMYARPHMSLRYGVPHVVVRGGYAPRYGYTMMPRRVYRPLRIYN